MAAAWGALAAATDSRVDVDAPVRCLGIRRGAIYQVDDVADDLQLTCPAHPAEIGSVLCVPMIALRQVVGVIHLERSAPAVSSATTGAWRHVWGSRSRWPWRMVA